MIYKLKIWCEPEHEEPKFKDLYFDVSKITGWFIPDKRDDRVEENAINILFEGDMITVLQENHIVKYLTEKFVETAIEH